jgi:Predicted transcriptional regulator
MITFDPLWDTLERKKISQYTLIKEYGFSTGTLDALRKNKSITLNTLNDLCNILQCEVSEIIKFTPDKKREGLPSGQPSPGVVPMGDHSDN